MRILRQLLPLLLLLSLPVCTTAFTFSGKCVEVTDGDTIKVTHGEKVDTIRLHGVDCPEKRQSFGPEATKATTDFVLDKTVAVEVTKTDIDGRIVGVITVSGVNVNQELVRRGMAWWARQYAPRSYMLRRLEKEARAKRIGLWSEPNPVPPWEFRQSVSAEPSEPVESEDTNKPEETRDQSPPSKADQRMVYLSDKGECYHTSGCRTLKRVKRPVTVSEAKKQGFRSCGLCKPGN